MLPAWAARVKQILLTTVTTHPERSRGTCCAPFPNATNLGRPTWPDFLPRLVALIHSMRLSLMKGAHPDFSSAARQEIGVKPCFCPPRRAVGA